MSASQHPPFKNVEASRAPFQEQQYECHQTPSPNWVPGNGANGLQKVPEGKFLEVDPSNNFNNVNIYKLMISGVVPRPIGFVSSLAENGVENLAPFSYFNACGDDPPTIMISVNAGANGKKKDTHLNILHSKEFTVQIISEWFAEAANYTSVNAPREISEWDLSGLTKAPSKKIRPSRVAEAAFSMECTLLHSYDLASEKAPGNVTATIFIAKVVMFHIREDLMESGAINIDKLRPISRLGGISYGRTLKGYELERPVWAQEETKPEVQKTVAGKGKL